MNTFGIDVSAGLFTSVQTTEHVQELVLSSSFQTNKRLIIGGGSNILFTTNFNGLVVKNEIKGREIVSEDSNHFVVRAGAGENWHSFVSWCVDKGYAGLENLSLIPGCVGASPMQNIGAYGVEMKDVFHSLEAISTEDGTRKEFTPTECSFGYRESVFKNKEKDRWIIVSVNFKLNKRPVFLTNYGAIEAELERMGVEHLTIRAIANAVINIRKSKLPDPKVLGNAGSFFKNPVIELEHFNTLKLKYPSMPSFPVSERAVKVPAGWLIETAGWKGKKIGDCGVHAHQALVLVNYGGSRGSEILELSTMIMGDISEKFQIQLEREVNIF